jgi:hypothetical protein
VTHGGIEERQIIFVCNGWQWWVITPNSTRTYETLISEAPFEELTKKCLDGPQIHLFLNRVFEVRPI